jgi:hypothetical protein
MGYGMSIIDDRALAEYMNQITENNVATMTKRLLRNRDAGADITGPAF